MLFSMGDNIRSIPSMVDGFKPGQRKVLYGSIKRPRNTEIKVAQLANYVAGATQYHHGEASVAATIIGMAQDFVGSNNINLLEPAGQFGSRHEVCIPFGFLAMYLVLTFLAGWQSSSKSSLSVYTPYLHSTSLIPPR